MNPNKKIQGLSTYFYPVSAGLETVVLEVYGRLASQGWNVDMFVTNMDIKKRGSLNSCENVKNIKVHRYPNFLYSFWPFAIKLDFHSGGLICFHDFDIFPHVFIFLKIWLLKILNKKNFSVIFTGHGGFSISLNTNSPAKLKLKQVIDHSLGVFLINRVADKIQVVSKQGEKSLIKSGINPNLIYVIGNGIEELAFSDINTNASEKIKGSLAKIGNYIVQVGRIDPVKNFETPIKCLKYLPNNIKLLIIGEEQNTDYRIKLENLAENLGVKERVIFFGKVAGTDKYYIMKHAIAMVHMALSEGFGLVVLEAMSQGCVCVVSKNTALEELIINKQNGFCENYYDFEKVAEDIKFIINMQNGELIKSMRKKNVSLTLNKGWGNIVKIVENFYIKTINETTF
jgi:glycosyltransferase involved in cell wall biosynthesis